MEGLTTEVVEAVALSINQGVEQAIKANHTLSNHSMPSNSLIQVEAQTTGTSITMIITMGSRPTMAMRVVLPVATTLLSASNNRLIIRMLTIRRQHTRLSSRGDLNIHRQVEARTININLRKIQDPSANMRLSLNIKESKRVSSTTSKNKSQDTSLPMNLREMKVTKER